MVILLLFSSSLNLKHAILIATLVEPTTTIISKYFLYLFSTSKINPTKATLTNPSSIRTLKIWKISMKENNGLKKIQESQFK